MCKLLTLQGTGTPAAPQGLLTPCPQYRRKRLGSADAACSPGKVAAAARLQRGRARCFACKNLHFDQNRMCRTVVTRRRARLTSSASVLAAVESTPLTLPPG